MIKEIKNLLHAFGFHDWTQWSNPGAWGMQVRYCKVCNKADKRYA